MIVADRYSRRATARGNSIGDELENEVGVAGDLFAYRIEWNLPCAEFGKYPERCGEGGLSRGLSRHEHVRSNRAIAEKRRGSGDRFRDQGDGALVRRQATPADEQTGLRAMSGSGTNRAPLRFSDSRRRSTDKC